MEKDDEKVEKKKSKPKVEEEKQKVNYSKLTIPELRKILNEKGIKTKYRGYDNKKDLINYINADSCTELKPCSDPDKICDIRNNICVEEEVLPKRTISKYENYAGTEAQIKNLIKIKEPVEEIIQEEKQKVEEEVYLSEVDEKQQVEEEVYLSEVDEKQQEEEEVYLSEEEEKQQVEEEVYLSEVDEKQKVEEEVYLSEVDEKQQVEEEVYLSEVDEKHPEEEENFDVQNYTKSILLSTREDDKYIEDVITDIQEEDEDEDENLYSIKRSIYKSLGLIR